MRNNLFAGAVLLAALAAGCGRAPTPAPDPAGGVTLTAPSATIVSPLAAQTSSYTNEMQAQNLRAEAAALGISKFGKPAEQLADTDGQRETITYQEGLDRTRATAREIEKQRHALERDKNKTVALPTPTPGLVPGNKEGAPIENSAEESGSKVPNPQ